VLYWVHLIVSFGVQSEVICGTSHRRLVGEMCPADNSLPSGCDRFCMAFVENDGFHESHGQSVGNRIIYIIYEWPD
jgi:hypothetical protein